MGHHVDDPSSSNGERTWTYVLAINTASDRRTVTDRLDLVEIGLSAPQGSTTGGGNCAVTGTSIRIELEARDSALFVCCPIVGGTFEVGDTTKYVTVAARTPAS